VKNGGDRSTPDILLSSQRTETSSKMTGDDKKGPGEDEMQADSAVTKETECDDQESTSSDTKQRKNEPLAKCSKCKKRHARRGT
jgi:hypothetical protein